MVLFYWQTCFAYFKHSFVERSKRICQHNKMILRLKVVNMSRNKLNRIIFVTQYINHIMRNIR